jgi:hypothetical protein
MKSIVSIVVVILQLIAANLLGFVPAGIFGIGNGWELVVFVVGFSLGVWGVGALAAKIGHSFLARQQALRLVATLLLSAMGVGVILVTPPIGFIRILYPLVGAFLGYYLSPLLLKR